MVDTSHDVLIKFPGNDAIVETRPENYLPSFLGQDRESILYYVDRPSNPLDDLENPTVLAVTDDKIYFYMQRKNDALFTIEEAARFIGNGYFMPQAFSPFASSLNLFIGRDADSMEQAELRKCISVDNPGKGVHMSFSSDCINGSLFLPDNPLLNPGPRVKRYGSYGVMPIHKIEIRKPL